MDEKLLILHIDDEIGTLKLWDMMLQRYGYDGTLHTNSARDGLAIAFEQRPHMILLDTMIPDLDGFEICKRLRADERTRSAVILFVSIYMFGERVQRAAECGADASYSMPLLPADVRALMATWAPIALERRHAESPIIGGNPTNTQ